MNFSQIILEKEQKDLFIQIVEMVRKTPREQRMKLVLIPSLSNGNSLIIQTKDHKDYRINNIIDGDLHILASKGLLAADYSPKYEEHYLVTPEGFEYYEWLMKEMGKPVERIEQKIMHYFEFEDFKKQYSEAYEKLKQAEELLWSSDSDSNFTAIGHHCRDAIQEFADVLYSQVFEEKSTAPKAHDKNRIKAVIENKKTEISTTVRPFLEALYTYWDAMSDLVQRQEHGGQKEGEPLNWEDTRRVVFQTANVMFELHRTLGN